MDYPVNIRTRTWFIAVATLIGVVVVCSLGVWQLSRAAQKLAIQAAVDAQTQREPLRNPQLLASDVPLHRRAVLRGTWLPAHTVFLDSRQMQGRVGFFVVTPFQLEGAPVALLVQRGWAPRNFTQREELPAVETPSGTIEIAGRMAPLPGKLYEFTGADVGVIRQNLDLEVLRKQTGLPLISVTLQQTGDPSEGLARDWPVINSGVDKHYGYAFQWFGIGIVMIILFGWTQVVRPAQQRRKKLQNND